LVCKRSVIISRAKLTSLHTATRSSEVEFQAGVYLFN